MNKSLEKLISLEPVRGNFTGIYVSGKDAVRNAMNRIASEWKKGERVKDTDQFYWRSERSGEIRKQIEEPQTKSELPPLKHVQYLDSFKKKPEVIKNLKTLGFHVGLSQKKADGMIEDFIGEGYSPDAEQIAEWSGIYVESGNTIFSHKNDNVNGGVVWSKRGKDFEIKALFSGMKGVGTLLMAKAIKENMQAGQDLYVMATKDARSFYEYLGMVKIADKSNNNSLMKMDGDKAIYFANHVLQEVGQ